ncbi:hypothetical protein Tco_0351598 [Tanacetum coccineum]
MSLSWPLIPKQDHENSQLCCAAYGTEVQIITTDHLKPTNIGSCRLRLLQAPLDGRIILWSTFRLDMIVKKQPCIEGEVVGNGGLFGGKCAGGPERAFDSREDDMLTRKSRKEIQKDGAFARQDACLRFYEACQYMGLLDFIQTADPRKVRAVEVQKGADQVTLLESTKDCFMHLVIPVAGGSSSTSAAEVLVPTEERQKDVAPECNTPKMGRIGNDVPGALLHNTIAPVMRERPLSVV